MTKTRICKICKKEFEVPRIGKHKNYSRRLCCSDICSKKLKEQLFLENYGVTNPSQLDNIKEKKKQTTLIHYGVDNPSKNNEIKNKKAEKQKETTNKRFNTNIQKYGVPVTSMLDSTKQAVSKKLKGRVSPNKGKSMSESIKQKISKKLQGRPSPNKGKVMPKAIKLKISKSCIQKLNDPAIRIKTYNTHKKNNSFHISKVEDHFYFLLQEKFQNVQRQYFSEEYPFNCDFYIPDLNLYIEYQGTWTHGGKPYRGIDTDLAKLEIWKEKAKSSKFYENAINTWTIRDPLKREIAIQNNLNWIEFFNETEFLQWYEATNG